MTDFDLVVTNGLLIDGIQNQPLHADIAIADGKIVTTGRINPAAGKDTLNVQGCIVAPGFIDAHTHDEAFLFSSGDPLAKVSQGVTTDVLGACGKSLFPINPQTSSQLLDYIKPALAGAEPVPDWQTWSDLSERTLAAHGSGLSVSSMTGHGSIRIAVMGFANRAPSPSELETMQELLARELEGGCLGLSFGLSYPPGAFASFEELITMASTAARHDRPVAVHLRSESSGLIQAVEEMIAVARSAQCRMVISHHKAAGRKYHGQIHETISRIERAHAQGVDVCMDVYPYCAGNTSLTALLPPRALSGGIPGMLSKLADSESRSQLAAEINGQGDWENLVAVAGWDAISISSAPTAPHFEGLSLQQAASQLDLEPVDALFEMLQETRGHARVIVDDMDEDDICTVLSHPLTQVVSDSTDVSGKPHPRLYGAFPRVLGRYVREKEALTLVDAVKKMTSGPAQRYNLEDRGVIKAGSRADLVVFNPQEIADTATYQQPRSYAVGITHVISAGELLLEKGRPVAEVPVVHL